MVTNFEIRIEAKHIQILKLFTAKKCDFRPYLYGIHFLIDRSRLRITSSDGATLGAFQIENAFAYNDLQFEFIAPVSIFDVVGKEESFTLSVTKIKDYIFDIKCLVGVRACTERSIDAKYPAFTKLKTPSLFSGIACGLNPYHIARMDKASKIAGDKDNFARLYFNGIDSPAWVSIDDPKFLGVIMPFIPEPNAAPLSTWQL